MNTEPITTDHQPKDASIAAVADVGDLPRQTPTVAGLGSTMPAGPGLDRAGEPHDPSIHETPPRRNNAGRWARRRGNAARKAKGLPPSGATFRGSALGGPATPPADAVAGDPPAGDTTGTPPPDFRPGSRLVLDGPPPASGPDGAVVPADVIPPGGLTDEEAAAAGETLTRGFFGLAALTLDGKAWEPTPDERKAFAACLGRVWRHYNLPALSPAVELFFLVPPTVAKRSDQPKTKRLLDWITGGIGRLFGFRRQPAAAPPPDESNQVKPTNADQVNKPTGRVVPSAVLGGGANPMPSNPLRNR